MAVFDRKSSYLKTLLLALVLVVQVLGHAHAVDHEFGGDNSLCSICTVTGHAGSAIVDSGEADDVVPLQHTVPSCPHQAVSRTTVRHHHARAPPLS